MITKKKINRFFCLKIHKTIDGYLSTMVLLAFYFLFELNFMPMPVHNMLYIDVFTWMCMCNERKTNGIIIVGNPVWLTPNNWQIFNNLQKFFHPFEKCEISFYFTFYIYFPFKVMLCVYINYATMRLECTFKRSIIEASMLFLHYWHVVNS
jgi:hypothetical protein